VEISYFFVRCVVNIGKTRNTKTIFKRSKSFVVQFAVGIHQTVVNDVTMIVPKRKFRRSTSVCDDNEKVLPSTLSIGE
jgi:hypothetical protein